MWGAKMSRGKSQKGTEISKGRHMWQRTSLDEGGARAALGDQTGRFQDAKLVVGRPDVLILALEVDNRADALFATAIRAEFRVPIR
jgi:hypothetical protein